MANFTWAPNNGSRVDFYHYQLVDSLTELPILTSNTTSTTVELSLPYNVNVTFLISAYVCGNEVHRWLLISLSKLVSRPYHASKAYDNTALIFGIGY